MGRKVDLSPQLRHLGSGRHPLVIVENLSNSVDSIIALAEGMGPFPADLSSYYPGLRRHIGREDGAAWAYVQAALRAAGPYLAGAFDAARFALVGACFSMVTRSPDELLPVQRMPHFDSTDPNYVALIHYLGVPSPSGTAFFRHRATRIEQVDEENVETFVNAAKRESNLLTQRDGYVQGSNPWFEEIDRVDAVPDRLIFYQGSVLHSGIIPPTMPLDPDPRRGRLTANFFIRLERDPVQ